MSCLANSDAQEGVKECGKLLDSNDVLLALDLRTSALRAEDTFRGTHVVYRGDRVNTKRMQEFRNVVTHVSACATAASWPGLAALIIRNNSEEIHKSKAIDTNAFKVFKRFVAVAQDRSRSGWPTLLCCRQEMLPNT